MTENEIETAGEVTPAPTEAIGRRRRIALGSRALGPVLRVLETGPLLILLVLIVAMWLINPLFLSVPNLRNVLFQSSVVAILSIGSLIVILTGGIDLSIGATMSLTTVFGALAYRQVQNGLVVIAVILLVGVGVGLVNGLLFVKGRIPAPFIVTLATLSIAQGLGLYLTGSQMIIGVPPIIDALGNDNIGPIPIRAVVVIVLGLVAWWFTRWTQWGRWIYATGGGMEAARRMSIAVPAVLISVYVVSGFTAGIAGILTAGAIGGGSALLGQGVGGLFDAIAAVVIGGASIFGGRGSVWNAIIGALMIGVIRNGLALMNWSPFVEGILVGSTILIAVLLDVVRTQVENRIRTIQSLQADLAEGAIP
jgi:ribose transport system permease protein